MAVNLRAAKGEKRFAAAFSLALIGAVLWPIIENWRSRPRDNFPLSYYPMFSAKRAKQVKVTYAVGVDAAEQRHFIPYSYIGLGGMNQMRKHIRQQVRRGAAAALCRTLAARIAGSSQVPFADVTHIEVVTGTYGLNHYFRGQRLPISEQVHASYPVSRGTP